MYTEITDSFVHGCFKKEVDFVDIMTNLNVSNSKIKPPLLTKNGTIKYTLIRHPNSTYFVTYTHVKFL